MLIAALAPEARSLANLTAAKLAALNWGTISTFIPGDEAGQVLGTVRQWATEFGEISIGDGHDPIITATLSGVDYDSILERVSTEDNAQTRRELVRRLITDELGLPAASVSLVVGADQAYSIAVELEVAAPECEPAELSRLVDLAHATCPYSRATRGNIPVAVRTAPGP